MAIVIAIPLAACAPGERVWVDEQGNEAAVDYQGPSHCGWDSARILVVGAGSGRREYVRDEAGVLHEAGDALAEFDDDVALPSDATPTGITRDDLELWMVPDDEAVYIVAADHAERWPRFMRTAACA
jgi:hypothetical protein